MTVTVDPEHAPTALDEPDSLDMPGLHETARLIGKIILGTPLAIGLAGPLLIYGLIRGLNDRDDPRYTKRPADAP